MSGWLLDLKSRPESAENSFDYFALNETLLSYKKERLKGGPDMPASARSEFIATGDRRTLVPSLEDSVLLQREEALLLEVARTIDNPLTGPLLGQFVIEKKPVQLKFPVAVLQMAIEIMQQMAQGKPVSMIPSNAELTTQQAADFLNVSRPYFVKLLDTNMLPSRKVGSRRRVLFRDLIAFKTHDLARRNKVADELTEVSQEIANDLDEEY
jgi:excisionase family DNA binding protein